MRHALAALAILLPLPLHAWEAGTEGRLCTLTHAEGPAAVRLTYDPAGPLYSVTVTGPAPWPAAAVFAIRFEGGRALTITTDRHVLSGDGRALTVTDRGFGNVLNGLEFNATATAITGDAALAFDLAGAAPQVQTFRACATQPAA